jgi:acyl carrier protein
MSTHTIDDLEQRVRAFVTSNFHVADTAGLTRDTSLLDTGIIDSTGYLDLFKWIEEDFERSVASDDMAPSNFESIARIASYLQRKLA